MARYEIHGGNQLNGSVTISGAKNAAVAILPAAILIEGKCRIENVPDISDVRILLDILADLGVDTATKVVSTLRRRATDRGWCTTEHARFGLKQILTEMQKEGIYGV